MDTYNAARIAGLRDCMNAAPAWIDWRVHICQFWLWSRVWAVIAEWCTALQTMQWTPVILQIDPNATCSMDTSTLEFGRAIQLWKQQASLKSTKTNSHTHGTISTTHTSWTSACCHQRQSVTEQVWRILLSKSSSSNRNENLKESVIILQFDCSGKSCLKGTVAL